MVLALQIDGICICYFVIASARALWVFQLEDVQTYSSTLNAIFNNL